MLFLTFFPSLRGSPTNPDPGADPDSDSPSAGSLTSTAARPPLSRRDALIVGSLTLTAALVVGITSTALVFAWPHHTQTWANLLGTIAGILSGIQYLPQIYYTYRLRDVKSLSVVTMLIQVPGAFLFSFSLWLRVGWEGWSTWLMFVVTGLLQGVLLALATSYYVAGRRAGKGAQTESIHHAGDVDGAVDAADPTDTDERSRLVSGRHAGRGYGSQSLAKGRPISGTQRSNASTRQLGQLYAATPPDLDSDHSSSPPQSRQGGRTAQDRGRRGS